MKKNLKIVSHQFILFMFTDKIFIKKESNFKILIYEEENFYCFESYGYKLIY